MAINVRLIAILTMISIAVVMMASAAFAAPGKSGETKPGWGHGDKNHVHTGPPGLTVRP